MTGAEHLAAAIASDDVGVPELLAAVRHKCLAAGVKVHPNIRAMFAEYDRDRVEIENWWARVKARKGATP